jgi:hypothetical protein
VNKVMNKRRNRKSLTLKPIPSQENFALRE